MEKQELEERIKKLEHAQKDLIYLCECQKKEIDECSGIRVENSQLKHELRELKTKAKLDRRTSWTDWEGGKCPVDLEAMTEVRFRDGVESSDDAANWDWEHGMGDYDIVAYRVVE